MWLGEQITAKGVGNGISIIIFAGIVAAIPNAVNQIYAQQFQNAGDAIVYQYCNYGIINFIAIIAIIVGVIYVQQALRKIPIQYAKRVTGTWSNDWWSTDSFTIESKCCGGYSSNLCCYIFYYTTINCIILWNK